MRISVGICAHNEAKNIGRLLRRLVSEPLEEIIVVASGCTDATVQITREFESSGVRTCVQEKREGKASAVNLFIKEAQGDILVLESADTIPSQFCFKYLMEPFADKTVGMVGAHPVPVNSRRSMMGRIAHLLWEVHHQSALIHPKAGEVCAFRNVVKMISPETPVDEAYIEREIVQQGYRVVYAPRAVVFNKGAETIKDFMRQRQRIYHGHLLLKRLGYEVPTMSLRNLALATMMAAGKHYRTLAAATLLELKARRDAERLFSVDGYKPTIWEMADTTKEVE